MTTPNIQFKRKINIQRLLKARQQTDKELENAISKLDNYGGECHCDRENGTTDIIHHGEFDEIFTYCLACGGVLV